MTDTTAQSQAPDNNIKELNFRQLEAKYERQLQQERAARMEAERIAQERSRPQEVEEDDSEPYVDHKKLDKKLAKFGQQSKQETQSEINKAVQVAIKEERKQNWLDNHKDFHDVLQHAEKFAQNSPELAEDILTMPEGFERQKLVYNNIKSLRLHEEPKKQPSIQEKVDANRKSPYYQPSGVGSAPYSSQSNFSPSGQKDAYEKMQELKNRLRL